MILFCFLSVHALFITDNTTSEEDLCFLSLALSTLICLFSLPCSLQGLQEQLLGIIKLLKACRLSARYRQFLTSCQLWISQFSSSESVDLTSLWTWKYLLSGVIQWQFREIHSKIIRFNLTMFFKSYLSCVCVSVLTEARQLPTHLFYQQPPLFSMDDLLRVKKGQLVAQARAVLHAAISHVESCEVSL